MLLRVVAVVAVVAVVVLTVVLLPVALFGAAGIVWLAKTDH